jgi:hypothetical protein
MEVDVAGEKRGDGQSSIDSEKNPKLQANIPRFFC